MESKRPLSPDQRVGFWDMFTPKLITVLREGYGLSGLRSDALAGLTVAIVAMPLSMAIAIASGLSPERGLFTAIVGGFLVSMLGGSRFQIGGPAGAFIVVVAATVERHGIDGMILATMMSGVFLLAIGYARAGTFIKLIPYPVTVGFTAGIGVIIFTSQIKDLLGLSLVSDLPSEFIAKVTVLAESLGSITPTAVALSLLTVVVILAQRRWRPSWPGILIAVVLCSIISAALSLPIETIGTRFGGIPSSLPVPTLPSFSIDKAIAVLPDAIAFALLGAIESLLSAVVADGMTGRRHRSNCELVAQGVANIGSALFGGMCVTGTIARTATNVRAGARGPVSGMLHALIILSFMLVAAPLASYIPLASLAGVLVVIAYNMVEKHAMLALAKSSKGDLLVLAVTFLLVVLRDLTEGIVVGVALGALLFINRMGKTLAIESETPLLISDRSDSESEADELIDAGQGEALDAEVYRISGAFFFGAASTVGRVLDRISERRKHVIIDLSQVPFLDSTAANVLEGTARKAKQVGVRFFITGASLSLRNMLQVHGVDAPMAEFEESIDQALEKLRADHLKP
ncbi:MAG: SulP family inorganic anion transporter [Alphaproteobacteria bacterium]|nr:SulP family inorganic anion transporter [Alphaproteobacteria bacterium]